MSESLVGVGWRAGWGGGLGLAHIAITPEHPIFRFAKVLSGTTDTDMLVVKHLYIYIYIHYHRLTSF